MKTLVIVSIAAAGVFAGCASQPVATREPYVKPGLILLTADQAQSRGIKVGAATREQEAVPLPRDMQSLDASAVTMPAGVKVYTLNRTVDPSDPDLMHEEHVVYRRETSPKWRLNAPAGEKILVGPRITDGQQNLQPVLDKELTTFLADQRRTAQSNQQAITALFQAVDALNRQQEALIRRELKNSAKTDAAAAAAAPKAGAQVEGTDTGAAAGGADGESKK